MVYDVIVIGGGPAGLAAACSAREQGAGRVLVLERDRELGGILNQCIHNGFGLHYFGEELTGPEYAGRFIRKLKESGAEWKLDTMVLSLSSEEAVRPGEPPLRLVRAMNPADGLMELRTKTVVLSMGCRERTRGAIAIPGDRCAGVFTAGTAQRFVNMEGKMVGKRVVILGSGDIGLIMARRLTLEGAQVLACIELMPYSGGLQRNIVQCLEDYDIPLYLSHTITDIRGKGRVQSVSISPVNERREPLEEGSFTLECDTVLLSVGLIPENEITRAAGIEMDPRTNGAVVYENMETSLPGVFACGNAVQVHDLVDFVTQESERAGAAAARAAPGGQPEGCAPLVLRAGDGISYTVPQKLRARRLERGAEIFFRVRGVMDGKRVTVRDAAGALLASYPREHMAPGEMERIMLPKKLLDAVKGTVLTIAAEEKEAEKE